jgi:hypothetical protein
MLCAAAALRSQICRNVSAQRSWAGRRVSASAHMPAGAADAADVSESKAKLGALGQGVFRLAPCWTAASMHLKVGEQLCNGCADGCARQFALLLCTCFKSSRASRADSFCSGKVEARREQSAWVAGCLRDSCGNVAKLRWAALLARWTRAGDAPVLAGGILLMPRRRREFVL